MKWCIQGVWSCVDLADSLRESLFRVVLTQRISNAPRLPVDDKATSAADSTSATVEQTNSLRRAVAGGFSRSLPSRVHVVFGQQTRGTRREAFAV